MEFRMKRFEAGDVVKVNHCFGGYRLPDELSEGEAVKVVSRDIGYIKVRTERGEFIVALACVDSGRECSASSRFKA